jgi:hypothetical protein
VSAPRFIILCNAKKPFSEHGSRGGNGSFSREDAQNAQRGKSVSVKRRIFTTENGAIFLNGSPSAA